jgi:hypothetical protein
MNAVLVIVALLSLLVIVFASSRRKHHLLGNSRPRLEPPAQPYQSLFAAPLMTDTDLQAAQEEAAREAEERRAALLARAARGDFSALTEAQSVPALYGEVLTMLVERALSGRATAQVGEPTGAISELASYITRHDGLRANARLAGAIVEKWAQVPNRRTLAETLHVAALSGDAACYQAAAQAVLGVWRAGRLPHVSDAELYSAVESHYWLLSPAARESGAGFALKEFLAAARRELEAARQASA